MTPENNNLNKNCDPWYRPEKLDQLTSHDIWWMRRDFIERLLPDVDGLKIAEIGSGSAHDSITFAERGAVVTAVDYSQPSLDMAHEIYDHLRLPIQTVRADAQALPFKDGQFDVAFNAGVLEHFTDDQLERVVDEMIRVVKPGGMLLAFCPNRHNIFYQQHLKNFQDQHYDYERAFTAKELRKRLESRGLKSIQTSGVHIHPTPNYLLPKWLPKHHKIEPVSRKCFSWFENLNAMHGLKSLIGQDFVIWGKTPYEKPVRIPIRGLSGGPAVKYLLHPTPLRKAA